MKYGDERLPLRFWQKVHPDGPGGCWEWVAGLGTGGYASFSWDGKTCLAHKLAYQRLVGQVPDGLELDHMCRVRHCVNPEHLEPVTHVENVRRGDGGKYLLAKTHCPQGHPYSEENTYTRPSGSRCCRTCRRESQRVANITPEQRKINCEHSRRWRANHTPTQKGQ